MICAYFFKASLLSFTVLAVFDSYYLIIEQILKSVEHPPLLPRGAACQNANVQFKWPEIHRDTQPVSPSIKGG